MTERAGLTIKIKDQIKPKDLAKELTNLGYENVGVSTPAKEGQFGGRGNLIDLWLERYKMPVRIDLIGETIENLYLFNSITQIKGKRLKELYIVPFGSTPKLAPKWTKKAIFPAKGGKYERLFLSEIAPGDLVVHIDHGVGRFLGIGDSNAALGLSLDTRQTRLPKESGSSHLLINQPEKSDPFGRTQVGLPQTSDDSTASQHHTRYLNDKKSSKQYLVVEYAKGDKLYVPVEQIERVTKYIGVPGYKPRLNTLGTSGWEKIKSKVEGSIFKTAKDLLTLYAKREMAQRPAYSKDTAWQEALEDSFEYKETEDQIRVTQEIKKDLESTVPMDRVLVGDVGFGKTEVAVRVAFKVLVDGKQVAVLAPTTLLAEQHFHLLKERLKQFPVEVEMLSRFKDKGEQAKILENLKIGKVDIVIGTHRLLSPDVQFKDLGLLIVDEEHRFGVVHKEKFKKLRTSLDVLGMSATPIPRTLYMTLTKLRDISLLGQPPAGRQPIRTYIGEYSEGKIKRAIEREIDRGGQVYYLCNRVSRIAQKASQLTSLVPKARVIFAHGQMDKEIKNLEAVMDEFYSGQADVLVCTTIIGSGLDMPNVNTIIIEDVQRFGLAELHQLRGRVGRSERKAYAHLFYPKNYVPEGQTLERLLAISRGTELGSGFKLAEKDLEIRGAGNLLGKQQSGNIALMGFELYIQLLSQTIEKLKLTAS